ncbi:hypothetical protein [Halorubrum trueperi]|uniref:Right-handed parallel beta-helix repeat-containing protein n=1 Tax=Halorubrum trueperi TaxID=2004704 RepID=A0ABD5UNJ1_9EURY
MKRRSFLRRTAIGVGGAVVLAGCGGDPGPGTDDRSDRDGDDGSDGADAPDDPPVPDGFDRVVNVVNRGADPSGEESLVPILEDIDPDGSVVFLPAGTYRMDDTWRVTDFERLALVGRDATIVPSPEQSVQLFSFDGEGSGTELRVEGLDFDYSHEDARGRMLHLKIRDGLLVRNVTAFGTVTERPSLVRVDVTDSDGEGLVDRLRLPDGAAADTGITGCYVGNDSRGDITFRDCRIEGFPDNGLYADPPAGSITVDGGYFANCGISNVRVRGDSTIRDAYVRCDSDHLGFENMRGIRLTDYEPQDTPEPAVVENCRVDMLEVSHSDGAIELSGQLARAVVRDTHVRVNADDVPAFNAKEPDSVFEELGILPSVELENVTVEGSAGEGDVIGITGRSECAFSGLDIHQTGPNRDGVTFSDSRDNVIRNARIDVTGDAIVLSDSETDTFDVDVVEDANENDPVADDDAE